MEAIPAFLNLPEVKAAYQKFLQTQKKEERPSIRKKLDMLQKKVDQAQETPRGKTRTKKTDLER